MWLNEWIIDSDNFDVAVLDTVGGFPQISFAVKLPIGLSIRMAG